VIRLRAVREVEFDAPTDASPVTAQ
jgi:hypothetical protein